MQSNYQSQLQKISRKRKHRNESEMKTSDEYYRPNVKVQRLKQHIDNLANELINKTDDNNCEMEATCSSENVEWNNKMENTFGDNDTAACSNNEEKVEKNYIESGEQCPICLKPFTDQQVAVTFTCNHCFCFNCIMALSATENICPVDRQAFDKIEIYRTYIGKAVGFMPIQARVKEKDDRQENVENGFNWDEPWNWDTMV